MLYRIIYPVYRIEADSAEKAKLYANNLVEENIHLIRVEPVAAKQSLLGMLIRGPQ